MRAPVSRSRPLRPLPAIRGVSGSPRRPDSNDGVLPREPAPATTLRRRPARVSGALAGSSRVDGRDATWVERHVSPARLCCRSTALQARPQCGHGKREPARKPKRRSTRRRAKSKSLLTTRHGGSSCNASSNGCFMLRTGAPSVNDQASYPPDIGELGRETALGPLSAKD
jgi:hypothetical protein